MKPIGLDIRGMQPGFKGHFGRGLGRLAEALATHLPEAAGDLPLAGVYQANLPKPDPNGLPGLPRFAIPQPMPHRHEATRLLGQEILCPWTLRNKLSLIHHVAHLDAPAFPVVPVVVTVPDVIMAKEAGKLAGNRLQDRLFRSLEARAARKAKRVIAISEFTGQEVVQYLGISPDLVRVTPLGADARFKPINDPQILDRVKRKYDLPDIFLLTVGGFDPRKNAPRLVRAFGQMITAGHGDNVHLLMAGSTNHKAQVRPTEQAIQEAGLNDRAGFLGFVDDDDLPVLYNLAKALIFPSLYEGFGLPVLEAMACGCPTITANNSSLPEVAGQATIYIDAESEENMALAMASFLENDNQAARLKEQGLAQAKLFSWQRTAKLTVDVYKEVIAEIGL